MTRPVDSPIPPAELLFRAIRPEDVDGSRVLGTAIDLPASSVVREKYGQANSPLIPTRPHLTGVAEIVHSALPAPQTTNNVAWEFLAVDNPLPDDDAHAEIRLCRVADRPSVGGNKPGSKAAREELKALLADTMRVRIKP